MRENGSKNRGLLFSGLYRENESEDHPYIETYVKLQTCSNHLIPNLINLTCRKDLKSSPELRSLSIGFNGGLI